MKHRLLVAVDGQKSSAKTVEYVAQACAGTTDAENGIVLFHVLRAMPPSLEAGDAAGVTESRERFVAKATAAAETMLAEFKTQLVRTGVPANGVTSDWVEEGNIAELILAAARDHQCDTIVLGRRGDSMIGEFLVGGVAEKLLRHRTGYTIWLVE